MYLILDKINQFNINYPHLNIEYKLLSGNEISDDELFLQVKDRRSYDGYYAEDDKLLRGMQCHYNFEKCGEYILEKERSMGSKFKYIIYIRPDLCFLNSCDSIDTYDTTKVILFEGPSDDHNDHAAIIPRDYLDAFFFGRMNVYRNNTEKNFQTPETVYWHTISYETKRVGKYYIKRNAN